MASAPAAGADVRPAGTRNTYATYAASGSARRRGTPFRLFATGFALTGVGLLLAACSGPSATSSAGAQAQPAAPR
ncbi:MAG: hypothetical protein ACYCVZ_08015, partial [Streptosporangiaceae bacterium]